MRDEATPDEAVEFGPFVLDGRLRELRREGQVVPLQRKPMDLLWYLIRHRDRIVPGTELLEQVWPDTFVGDQALSGTLRDLRRALGDGGRGLIRTLRGQGYRFTGEPVIREASPATAARQAPAAPAPWAHMDAADAFVGRDAEMACLRGALRACLGGRGRIGLIQGPAGVGKSRLADQLASEAAQNGVALHSGASYSSSGAPPLWPWTQMLRSCLRTARDPAQRSEWLYVGGNALQALLPEHFASQEGAAPSIQSHFEIAHACMGLLSSAAVERPRMLLFEDLHWADTDSLGVLELVGQSLHDVPVFLVVTLREGEPGTDLRRVLAVIQRSRGCERVLLEGLSVEAVRALLSTYLSPTDALVSRVHQVTSGNALFVTELARLYADRGLPDDSEEISVPAAVRDVMELQLARRSPFCREALRFAAVSWGEFSIEVLRQVLGVERDEVLNALSEAEAVDLIRELPEMPGVYRFRHALWREFLYESFTKADVRRAHLRTGEALEAVFRNNLAPHATLLARHFAEAAPVGGAEKAVRYTRSAAEHWASVCALGDSAEQYKVALRALEAMTDAEPRMRSELHITRGLLLWLGTQRFAKLHECRADFEAGARLAREAGEPDLWARALVAKANLEVEEILINPARERPSDLYQDLEAELGEALAALPPDSSGPRARVLASLTYTRWLSHDPEGAKRNVAEAERIAAPLSDPEPLREALIARWRLLCASPDALEERRAIGERIWASRDQAAPRLWLSQWLVFALAEAGDLPAADALVPTRTEAANPTDNPDEGWLWRAMRATVSGRFDEAERQLASLEQLGGYWLLIARLAQTFWLRVLQGRVAEVLPAIEAEAHTPRVSVPATSRILLARCYADLGRLDEAREELALGLKRELGDVPFNHEWIVALSLAAEVLDLVGEPHDASRAAWLYEKLHPYEDRLIFVHWAVACLGSVSRPLGLLAAAQKEWDRSVSHLERALTLHEQLGARPWVAYARLDLARALSRRGRQTDAPRAHDLARRASAEADRLGMASLARRARAELKRLGTGS